MVQGGFSIAGLEEKDRRWFKEGLVLGEQDGRWFKEGLVLQGWERRIEDGSRRV